MINKGKQLTLSQRIKMEEMLNQRRSKIFYCDPQQSSQKPHVENNHNFIREIFIYGKHLADKLNIQKIAKDEVTTTPRLLA